MADSRMEPPTLVLTVIAAGWMLLRGSPFDWLTTVAGLSLLLIVLAYEGSNLRSPLQSIAFSTVCGLSFTVAAAIALQKFARPSDMGLALPITWACASAAMLVIDRSRTREEQVGNAPLSLGAAPSGQTLPLNVDTRPFTPNVSQGPARASSASAAETMAAEPLTSEPRVEQPPPPMTASEPPPSDYETSTVAAPAAGYQAPETMIYVDVVGQGISFMRSVRAEHVARDIYRIVDAMPAEERWRYEPGQTVRCKKKKLSHGKALVAVEEIVLQRVS